MLNALIRLIITGDYTPAVRPLVGDEDSTIVDIILTITGR